MNPFVAKNGYKTIAPKFGEVRRKLLVHRLVALAFVDGHFPNASVNHIDGDKLNNQASNLEWTTLAENTAHQWRIGLVDLRGENHPSSKITDAQVSEIRSLIDQKIPVREIARAYKISESLVYKIRSGTKRPPIAGYAPAPPR